MLKGVRHVPDLRLNLMSGIALDKEGFQNYFGNGRWKLSKGTMVVARGEVCRTLYKTLGKICKNGLNIVADSSPNLWHRRLGHMSEKGLQILAKRTTFPLPKVQYLILVITVYLESNIEFHLAVNLPRNQKY